jgi:polysaccharide biosynthesis transport protein
MTDNSGDLRSVATSALPHLDLHQWLGILARQYKIFLAVLLMIVGIVSIILSQVDYRYTSTALLVIDESEAQLVGVNPGLSADSSLNNRVDTEVEILRSSSVILGAIERLRTWNDSEFGLTTRWWRRLLTFITHSQVMDTFSNAASISELSDDQRAILVDQLSNNLKISRRGLTSAITISATSLSAEKASNVANSVAEAYFDLQVKARASTAQRAADFLQQRVNELANAIHDNDVKIAKFVAEQSDKVGTAEVRAEISRLRDQISSLLKDQTMWSTQIMQLQQLRSAPSALSLPELKFAPEIQRLAAERNQLAGLAANSPQTKLNLEEAESRLLRAADEHAGNLRLQLRDNKTESESLGDQLQVLMGQQSIPSDVTVELYRLQRDAETVRKLYDNYLTRLAEAQQKISLALPDSRIVARAIVPHEPSFPPTKLLLAISFCTALGLGGAAAMLREHVVGGFASSEQLESVTQLRAIATIPHSEQEPHSVIFTAPFSSYSESIRRLRIGIENLIEPGRPSVVLVTSTESGEGKTTLALSLARALAMSGRRTVLIDCDLRHPSVQKFIGRQSPANLLDLLLAPSTGDEIDKLAALEVVSGLYHIGAEPTQSDASDILLASPRFEEFIKNAKSCFDVIVLDSPPVGYVVDARVIGHLADLVLYVVRYGSTSQRDVVGGLREMLNTPKSTPLVTTLNNARSRLSRYYHAKGDVYYRG